MTEWLAKLRALLAIGIVWGVVGGGVGLIASGIGYLLGELFLSEVFAFGLIGARLGFVIGSGFAGLLALTKGRKTVDQLSATWGASFGAVAGVLAYLAVVLLVTQPDLSNGYFLVQALLEAALSSLVGAGLGAGTLLAAKRTTERLDSGATPPEKRLA